MRKIVLSIIAIILSFSNICLANGIVNDKNLLQPEAFLDYKNGDKLILSAENIRFFNNNLVKKESVLYNLEEYPQKIDKQDLVNKIKSVSTILDEYNYLDGNLINDNDKKKLQDELNIDKINDKIKYGVVLRRTNIRTVPTAQGLYESPSEIKFDYLQESVVDPSTAVIVLHVSKNNQFYYIQTTDYSGWVSAKNIALAKREDWLKYLNPQKFMVVTDSKKIIPFNGEMLMYQMGAKIPVVQQNGTDKLLMPYNGKQGLGNYYLNINNEIGLHKGYLAYTTNNIIKQSYKMLGDVYGWGGLDNSVDCSGFIQNIYKTVGINLPRNADQQENSLAINDYRNITPKGKRDDINKLAKGSLLFMDGHVMMYLGSINNEPYVIHSLGSYSVKQKDNSMKKIPILKVVVSDLNLQRYSGKSFLTSLTGSAEIK